MELPSTGPGVALSNNRLRVTGAECPPSPTTPPPPSTNGARRNIGQYSPLPLRRSLSHAHSDLESDEDGDTEEEAEDTTVTPTPPHLRPTPESAFYRGHRTATTNASQTTPSTPPRHAVIETKEVEEAEDVDVDSLQMTMHNWSLNSETPETQTLTLPPVLRNAAQRWWKQDPELWTLVNPLLMMLKNLPDSTRNITRSSVRFPDLALWRREDTQRLVLACTMSTLEPEARSIAQLRSLCLRLCTSPSPQTLVEIHVGLQDRPEKHLHPSFKAKLQQSATSQKAWKYASKRIGMQVRQARLLCGLALVVCYHIAEQSRLPLVACCDRPEFTVPMLRTLVDFRAPPIHPGPSPAPSSAPLRASRSPSKAERKTRKSSKGSKAANTLSPSAPAATTSSSASTSPLSPRMHFSWGHDTTIWTLSRPHHSDPATWPPRWQDPHAVLCGMRNYEDLGNLMQSSVSELLPPLKKMVPATVWNQDCHYELFDDAFNMDALCCAMNGIMRFCGGLE